ncbi:hypothetical protein GG681_15200 [Epibacterium sp. SM1969]|uniref:SCP-2 sterol transfer family protein n=1 Tax=Tritonibacter aquimaris TaxID=2663379 RepID=A0A844B103_9RHOB|nr:hypothetical protein [Tritonibacter aquimaris]MQY43992.1 hypothetical protein [Tritonibacter aquimaris]
MLDILKDMGARLDQRPHLLRLGALFSETVLLQVAEDEFYLCFDRGRLVSVTPGPSRKTPWRFAFKTDAAALDAFWQPLPEPGFHDLFGLVKIGRARIDGDMLMLVKNLRFFKEFMALGRVAKEG